MKNAIILINELGENPNPDESDVLQQVEVVEIALKELGYCYERVFMGLDLQKTVNQLNILKPDLAINLFEGINEKPELIHLGASILQSLKIPYTGCRIDSIFITANKSLTKKILKNNNILTAEWFNASEIDLLIEDKTYIIKPIYEDASVGINENSIFSGKKNGIIDLYRKKYSSDFFIEEFIDGREFNISLLSTNQGVKMLSPAEIVFNNFPKNKPKILGYSAKWNEESFEYKNTFRTFDFKKNDSNLLKEIEEICIKCWNIMNLRGYARIDFRVDKNNVPYVLEINANPCISKDSGFYAAALKSGFSFTDVMKNIINDAFII